MVPSIVLVEGYQVLQKLRRPDLFLPLVERIEQDPSYRIVALDGPVIRKFATLTKPAEMHDRIIAATAILHDAAVVTRDRQIRETCKTIW